MELAIKNIPAVNNATMHIAIVTNCCDDWGGSEELWARTIPHLLSHGIRVTVLKDWINKDHPRYVELSEQNVALQNLDNISKKARFAGLLLKGWNKIRKIENHLQKKFERFLRRSRPNLVLISQGINFDGMPYAFSCALQKVPYVIVSQKAVEFYWPPSTERAYMTRAFREARKCYFVSKHNRQLTEEQFGLRFANAKVINNPVKISFQNITYPSTDNGFRLACIGRLFLLDKGQDILLRILAQPKWRERPVTVSFVGTGTDEEALRSMAALLDVKNIEFTGHLTDMQSAWKNYHALVLPSRSEGLPLVVLEAMAAARTVISTRAGGTQEVVENDVTGFIGEATLESFEATLERAWNNRHRWQQMGEEALIQIRRQIPSSPETEFANELIDLLYEG